MTPSQKNNEIKKKKGCFFCLKTGHRVKQCKTNVRCLICSKKHWGVMCLDLHTNQRAFMLKRTKKKRKHKMYHLQGPIS
ncbi:hypothetical protein X975_21846, partial [Stegodyphus mimosarum]